MVKANKKRIARKSRSLFSSSDSQLPVLSARRQTGAGANAPDSSVSPWRRLSRLRRYGIGNGTFGTIRGQGNLLEVADQLEATSQFISMANDRHGKRNSRAPGRTHKSGNPKKKKKKKKKKKRISASSQRARQPRRSGASMHRASRPPGTNAGNRRQLTTKQKRDLAALAALPDDRIDTSDIPELPLRAWKDAVRGQVLSSGEAGCLAATRFRRCGLAKKPGKGYQTRANHLLRQQMLADLRRP